VVDSSDVIVQVLDARDPVGTRSAVIEAYLKRDENAHKHMILVLNKVDLIPTWATAAWVRILGKDFVTVAFNASSRKAFGRGALIQLLRQFAHLLRQRRQISVGFVGYPNVGKSSVINTLVETAACKIAPIPGETKVWQYVTLTKRIYLIDCPGVVYPAGVRGDKSELFGDNALLDSAITAQTVSLAHDGAKGVEDNEEKNTPESRERLERYQTGEDDYYAQIVLRGVIRIERLVNPVRYIQTMLSRTKPEYINDTYCLKPHLDPSHRWSTHLELLEVIGRKSGRLLKGGEVDLMQVSRMLLLDWTRGRIPWFIGPPEREAQPEAPKVEVNEEGEEVEVEEESKLPAVEMPQQNMGAIAVQAKFDTQDAVRGYADGVLVTGEAPEERERSAKLNVPLGSAIYYDQQ
ncbi:nucleolar GTP-binding protein 2, partial [Kipferlia bialata]